MEDFKGFDGILRFMTSVKRLDLRFSDKKILTAHQSGHSLLFRIFHVFLLPKAPLQCTSATSSGIAVADESHLPS